MLDLKSFKPVLKQKYTSKKKKKLLSKIKSKIKKKK